MRKESDEMLAMVERFQFNPDPEHLPLANTPGRFLDLLSYLKGTDSFTEDKETLAEVFDITPRQINFYGETGERTFGLFDRSERGKLSLTKLGVNLSEKSYQEQISYLQHKLMRLPLFKTLQLSKTDVALEEIIELIVENDGFRERFSDSSIKRRASTLLSWMKWFEKAGLPLDDNEVAYYIEQNKELIYEIAHQYDNRKTDIEEHFAVASVGFHQALLHYNPDKDTKFSTFAYVCMKNQVFLFKRTEKKYNVYRHSSIDAKSDVYDEDISISAFNRFNMKSLEERLISNEDLPEQQLLKSERLSWIKQTIPTMGAVKQKVLELYYLHEKTQLEISKKLKMSQANVSKILKNAKIELRQRAIDAQI